MCLYVTNIYFNMYLQSRQHRLMIESKKIKRYIYVYKQLEERVAKWTKVPVINQEDM